MKLSVSTFYLPFVQIKEEISALEHAGIDMFHVDFMDGNFVQNLGMGIQDLDAVRACTNRPVDVHLMVNDPDRYVQLMVDHGADIIYIHPESCTQPAAVLQHIKKAGAKCGLALSPSMALPSVEELLPLIDYALVLTVNPGFANQSYLPYVENKAIRLIEKKDKFDYQVIIDGAVDIGAVSRLQPQGIDAYVLGNRILLEHDMSEYAACVEKIRSVQA